VLDPFRVLLDALLEFADGDPLLAAIAGSGFAAAMTAFGGIVVAILRPPRDPSTGEKYIDFGLGFSSGVMIVASFTSLLIPSIERFGLAPTLAGFVLGFTLMHAVNELVPHEHIVKGYEGPPPLARKIKAAWLVALAIIIHNVPEGMSIGAASAYSPVDGAKLSIAIGLQDFPEGASVALPVLLASGSRRLAAGLAALSGLSEVLAAVPTSLAASHSLLLLPALMGAGAGAMVYVVSNESLPETHRSGREIVPTLGFLLGFVTMLALDAGLG